MKLAEILFGKLLVCLILIEFSFYGLLLTQNNRYIIALFFCTAALVYVSYRLYLLESGRKAKVHKEYSFYYILDHPPTEDIFSTRMKNRM